ncbi:MAG TPA: carbon-nitrogen hydrolase family protein [Beijerinckiaceae bacterium]|jgi:aliphatic nitrilase|nr:carbon-nitrogen hydrolase family protein [Beijerinckiaceae bacterium]
MTTLDKTLRLAAVQAAPVFLDRELSTQKACELIREAGRNGADIVGFPEGFIPGHPGWQELIPATSELSLTLGRRLFKNAVEVPGPSVDALSAACREAGVYAVVGVNERRADTTGSLFNTQLFFGKDGTLLHKHQKIVPTIGERVFHTPGTTGSKASVKTEIGTISGLLCGENANPLFQYAVGLDYPVVHVASWPSHFGPGLALDGLGMQETIALITQGCAYALKCFVINSVAAMSDDIIEAYGVDAAASAFLKERSNHGGTSIIGPGGQIIAGPLPPGEAILYADVRLDDVIIPKFIHDFAGHYNRPDLFASLFNGKTATAPRRDKSEHDMGRATINKELSELPFAQSTVPV